MSKKVFNKVTSNLTEEEKQQKYLHARTSDWYDDIWKTVGKCVFCDLRDKYIIHEENDIVLTISLYPYIDGHMMIIPRSHIKSPKDFSTKQWETVRKFIYLGKKMIRKVHNIKSIQAVYKDGIEAQGTVNGHLHIHLIPFDAADLSIWNYRKLHDTPLDNAKKYRKISEKILKYSDKFEEKYGNKNSLPIVADLIILNKKKEILFQERNEESKFDPDILTLPGGHIDDFNLSIEEELAREIKEEINKKLNHEKFQLVYSQVDSLKMKKNAKYLNKDFIEKYQFVWNTYLYNGVVDPKKLKPGDDCSEIVWLSFDEAMKNDRVTEGVKIRLRKALQK